MAAAAKFAVNSDPSTNRPIAQLPKGVTLPPGSSPVPNQPTAVSSSGQVSLKDDKPNVNNNNHSLNISEASSSVSTPKRAQRGGRGDGIDDFIPDSDDHINNFLNDAASNPSASGNNLQSLADDSSDEDTSKRGNPLVVSIEEDFDEGIIASSRVVVPETGILSKDSSEDEQESQGNDLNERENLGATSTKIGFNLFVETTATQINSASSVESSEQPSSLESSGKKGKKSGHKKSSKGKHKKSSKKDDSFNHKGLEEFLSGDMSVEPVSVDSSAYEAL